MHKIERIACLYLTFLNSSGGVSFARLRKLMPTAYQGEPESARRKFERDKKELKELGLELECHAYDGKQNTQSFSVSDHVYQPVEEVYPLPDVFLAKEDYQNLAGILWRGMAIYREKQKEQQLLRSVATKLFYKNPIYALEYEQNFENKERRDEFYATSHLSFESDIESSLEIIYRTLKSHKVLYISYSNRKERKTHRFISGKGLISHKGRWSLVAYCHKAKAIRSFYIDRILSIEVADKEEYHAYPKVDIRKYSLHPLLLKIHPKRTIKVRTKPSYEESFRLFLSGAGEVSFCSEEGVFFVETSNQNGLFSWITRNVDAIESLGPKQIHDDFTQYLKEMYALYV